MTYDEWMESEPKRFLDSLKGRGGERKLRLFAAACCRQLTYMLTPEAQEGIDLAERIAEGTADTLQRKQG